MIAICILGNQLFEPKLLPQKPSKDVVIFMREDRDLCTHFRYHKHKIIFFLSAMRKYAEELREAGFKVQYEKLGEFNNSFEDRLMMFLKKNKCQKLEMFEIEDKFFEIRIKDSLTKAQLDFEFFKSPMFLTERSDFMSMQSSTKKPFMKTFYERQRKHLKILINADGSPVGGKWSFDTENRKPLPKNHVSPKLPDFKPDKIDQEVFKLVEKEFSDHPGTCEDFWLPTERVGARAWAKNFFENRFAEFGPYEDALSKDQPFLYHSVLTPYLNTGLITPKECVLAALKYTQKNNISMNSCEGFIRQVIGWREFIRGIYQNYSEIQESKNFFNHQKKLSSAWYSGNTGVPPLDDVIKKTIKYGYAHHIERLMVVGSLMLLLEIHPHEAHKWFMEMFIDSSDWVMGPNVYGMALFSDGGIFATKPYFCGSNYLRKMGGYPKGDWCDGIDGLYWGFIKKHEKFFLKNPRLSMMVRTAQKMPEEKWNHINLAANHLKKKLTI